MKQGKRIITVFVLCWVVLSGDLSARPGKPPTVLLSAGSRARVRIIVTEKTQTALFAASELAHYLEEMSGAAFTTSHRAGYRGPALRLILDHRLGEEAYRISIANGDLLLAGGSGRALLYGAYALLRRLGCRWAAPSFSFYKGASEEVPRKDSLSVTLTGVMGAKPAFGIRKLDVEEGRSHTTENLLQLIDWMPKSGFNTLMVPLNYGGGGKVKWDNWRKALTPALKQRGLLIEVGGHGYQNFLNASMEDSTLFRKHPGWFGKDKNCNPSPEEYEVFNTRDPDAVRYFVSNILSYLRAHPEINIFDFWPPDGARWADCPALKSLGSGQDRQARLANLVDSAVRKLRPGLRLEIIAYARALWPPETVSLNPDILVDFCPIDQSYERQVYDTVSGHNKVYVEALRAWRASFSGDIGLYSYYRKYGWHSLPVVIPHYIGRDLKWYAGIPLQGISIYSEPGDWATYALNYFVLGRLAWDPSADVDSLVGVFCRTLYRDQAAAAIGVYATLEKTVRRLGNIPFTTLKSPEQLAAGIRALADCETRLDSAIRAAGPGPAADNLARLALAVAYGRDDLMVRSAMGRPALAAKRVASMVDFLKGHAAEGVFLIRPSDDAARYERYYGIQR